MIQNRKRGRFAKGKTRTKVERQLEVETQIDIAAFDAYAQSLVANLVGFVALVGIFALLVSK